MSDGRRKSASRPCARTDVGTDAGRQEPHLKIKLRGLEALLQQGGRGNQVAHQA